MRVGVREGVLMTDPRPPLPRNAALFVVFRVLFNCRFYYPVYTVLFLDLGASMTEFAVLNAIWAVAIVLLEVPSGALADQIGRKRLVVAAGIFMIVEMVLLLIAPMGGGALLFAFLLLNRLFSGAAEAAASGADEALAYDSIARDRRAEDWPRVMARLTRAMALGFIAAMFLGGASYDAGLINRLLGFLGLDLEVTRKQAVRFPIFLNLLTAIAALGVALAMREERRVSEGTRSLRKTLSMMLESGRSTLRAGGWILREPAALLLILIGVSFDSVVRLFLTLASEFYRLIEIDPVWFGVIGGGVSILGFLLSGLMERMASNGSPARNFQIVAGMILFGAVSLWYPIPVWGVVLLVPLFLSMRFLTFFLSHYLNEVTASHWRATVLSFRGLSINVGYGLAMAIFGLMTWGLGSLPEYQEVGEQAVFADAIKAIAILFVILVSGVILFKKARYRKSLDGLIAARSADRVSPFDL